MLKTASPVFGLAACFCGSAGYPLLQTDMISF